MQARWLLLLWLEELQILPWTLLGLLSFREWFRIGWHTKTLSLAYFHGNFVLHVEHKCTETHAVFHMLETHIPLAHILPERDSKSMCWTFLCYLLSLQMPSKKKRRKCVAQHFSTVTNICLTTSKVAWRWKIMSLFQCCIIF